MPLPTPNPKEELNDFIARFMGNEAMKREFPNHEQRIAVAHSQWEKKLSKELSKLKFKNDR